MGCLSKPNWTIGRAFVRESQIPEWQEKQKQKQSIKGAQANDVVTRNNSMTQLETPAGVS